jgi:hypothetical protein
MKPNQASESLIGKVYGVRFKKANETNVYFSTNTPFLKKNNDL